MAQEQLYYYLPQRAPGGDGQTLAAAAPGTGGGVYPANGPINPLTGMPYPIGPGGYPLTSGIQVQLPAYSDPPMGSTTLEQVTTNVVNVPTTGGSAGAALAASVLATAYAYNLSGITSSALVLTPGTVTSTVVLLTYNAVSPGVFRRFGIKIWGAMGLRAIRTQIQVNSMNSPGFTEEEMADFYQGNNPAPVFIPFKAQDTVTVLARNIDLYSAYLVTTRLSGWRYTQ